MQMIASESTEKPAIRGAKTTFKAAPQTTGCVTRCAMKRREVDLTQVLNVPFADPHQSAAREQPRIFSDNFVQARSKINKSHSNVHAI